MMRADIQIENGERQDTRDAFGLIYLSSDKRLAAPVRAYEAVSYAEEAGEHIDPRTVEDAFDFKITFVTEVLTNQIESGLHVNTRIARLNDALFVRQKNSDILQARQTTIYDLTKHRKITGYPIWISEPRDEDIFYSNNQELAVIELTLRVNDPKLCDFDYTATD